MPKAQTPLINWLSFIYVQSGPLRPGIPLQAHRPIHEGKSTGLLHLPQRRSHHPIEWNILTIVTGKTGTVNVYLHRYLGLTGMDIGLLFFRWTGPLYW